MSSASQSSGLLGYSLRQAARMEMLSGGVRLSYLVSEPSPLCFVKSESMKFPRHQSEKQNLKLEYAGIGQRILPVNVNHRARTQMDLIRSRDVLARFLKHNRTSAFIPSQNELSILPENSSENKTTGQKVFGEGMRYMPLQMVKPIAGNWAPAVRGSGTRSVRGQLHQERLDGKGFGWKKKARHLWQQDVDTNGFRPRRFF